MKAQPKKRMKNRFVCVSFADSRLRAARSRLGNQAKAMNVFDHVYLANEDDLEDEFRVEFATRLNPRIRGFGYWCWKAQVILQVLRNLKESDTLLYVDTGCHLNQHGLGRLREYLEILHQSESGILAFDLGGGESGVFSESAWTKGEVFDFFKVTDERPIVSTPQIQASVLLVSKRPSSVTIIEAWRQLSSLQFSLFDDSPSAWNYPDFREHRHDQSVFSVLGKLQGISLLSHAELYPTRLNKFGKPNWVELAKSPIQVRRDTLSGIKRFIGLSSLKVQK